MLSDYGRWITDTWTAVKTWIVQFASRQLLCFLTNLGTLSWLTLQGTACIASATDNLAARTVVHRLVPDYVLFATAFTGRSSQIGSCPGNIRF